MGFWPPSLLWRFFAPKRFTYALPAVECLTRQGDRAQVIERFAVPAGTRLRADFQPEILAGENFWESTHAGDAREASKPSAPLASLNDEGISDELTLLDLSSLAWPFQRRTGPHDIGLAVSVNSRTPFLPKISP